MGVHHHHHQVLMAPSPRPAQNGELTMLGEITHLQGIIDDLAVLTAEPHKLPPASEQVSGGGTGWDGGEEKRCPGGAPTHSLPQVIKDLKGSDYSWSYQTPPSSPSSSSSRKSSMCRCGLHPTGCPTGAQ